MHGIWASVRHPAEGFIGAALLMVDEQATPEGVAARIVSSVIAMGMEAGEVIAFAVPPEDVTRLTQMGMPVNRMVTLAELRQSGIMMALVEINPDAIGQMPPMARGSGIVH